jgi:hypothetical protein
MSAVLGARLAPQSPGPGCQSPPRLPSGRLSRASDKRRPAESAKIEECNMQPGAIVGHRQRAGRPIPTQPTAPISNRKPKLLETPQIIENIERSGVLIAKKPMFSDAHSQREGVQRPPHSNREALRLETGVTARKQTTEAQSNRENTACFRSGRSSWAKARCGFGFWLEFAPMQETLKPNATPAKSQTPFPAGGEKSKSPPPKSVSGRKSRDRLFCLSYKKF